MFRKLWNLLFGTKYSGVVDFTPVKTTDPTGENESIPLTELQKPYFISKKGIDYIKGFEALKLYAYPDTNGVWTIGYGTTAGVKKGMVITKEQAEKFLLDYLDAQDKQLNELLKDAKLLTQNQYDVICSFAYNIGITQFMTSTFLKKVLASDWLEAAKQLVWMDSLGNYHGWIYDAGKKIKGLINRRKTEQALFLQGIPN